MHRGTAIDTPLTFDQDAGFGFSDIGGAIGGAVSAVAGAVTAPVAAAIQAGTAIASGGNVAEALKEFGARQAESVRRAAPYVATVASFVPGIGSVGSAAITAGAALAEGKPIDQALLAGVRASLPGGPLAGAAFDAAVGIAQGQAPGEAALSAVRSQLPGGDLARAGFDAGRELARGGSPNAALLSAARRSLPNETARRAFDVGAGLASGAGGAATLRVVRDALPVHLARAFDTGAGLIAARTVQTRSQGGATLAAFSNAVRGRVFIPSAEARVAEALMLRPELRSAPVAQLARAVGVTPNAARNGLASLVGAMQRTARGEDAAGVELRPEPGIASRLGLADSYDAAAPIAGIAAAFRRTSAAPVVFHVAGRARSLGRGHVTALLVRVPAARMLPTATIARLFGPASGQDAGAVASPAVVEAQIILSTLARSGRYQLTPSDYGQPGKHDVDGVKGPRTTAATKSYQGAVGIAATGDLDEFTMGQLRTETLDPTVYAAVLAEAPGGSGVAPTTGTKPPASYVAEHQLLLAGVNRARLVALSPADYGNAGRHDVDGALGPRTASALRTYQAARGLPANGQTGPATLNALYAEPIPADVTAAILAENGAAPKTGTRTGTTTVETVVPKGASDPTTVRLAQQGLVNYFGAQGGAQPADFRAPYDVDGAKGPRTTLAVKTFQGRNGLATTGELDAMTLTALTAWASTPKTTTTPATKTPPTGTTPKAGGSDRVLQAQVMLAAYFKARPMVADPTDYGASPGEFDGIQGPRTTRAVKAFQGAAKLPQSGVIDEPTMSALVAATSEEPPALRDVPTAYAPPAGGTKLTPPVPPRPWTPTDPPEGAPPAGAGVGLLIAAALAAALS